jgi:hypothetical protein
MAAQFGQTAAFVTILNQRLCQFGAGGARQVVMGHAQVKTERF